jgi:hypothetical protein
MMTRPSVHALELATLTAVPARRVAHDGPFVLRSFLGGTGRANAATPLDPAFNPQLTERIERIAAFYRAAGLQPRIRSTPLDPAGLARELRTRGWQRVDETCVMAAPLAPLAAADPAVRALDRPAEAWLAVLATADYQTPARRAEKVAMPEMLGVPAAWLLLEGMACAFVVADGGLCGLFDVATARGAGTFWLQVAAANAPALALYAGLGFAEQYRYAYWQQKDD